MQGREGSSSLGKEGKSGEQTLEKTRGRNSSVEIARKSSSAKKKNDSSDVVERSRFGC